MTEELLEVVTFPEWAIREISADIPVHMSKCIIPMAKVKLG